jgi:hypothetical protein
MLNRMLASTVLVVSGWMIVFEVAGAESSAIAQEVRGVPGERGASTRPSGPAGGPAAQDDSGGPEGRSKRVEPFPGVVVDLEHGRVEVACRVIHPPEPLEQIICTPATREHETLFTANVLPSQLHAALLLLGAKPGTPGRFERVDDTIRFVPPTGDALDITIAVKDESGKTTVTPVESWIVAMQNTSRKDGDAEASGTTEFPESTWVFGGSLIQKNMPWMGEGEHYVADMTGSLIGFVTFGDEPVGVTRAIEDESAKRGIDWRANVAEMPAEGTMVTVYITRIVKVRVPTAPSMQ